jgi:hypothetical protein
MESLTASIVLNGQLTSCFLAFKIYLKFKDGIMMRYVLFEGNGHITREMFLFNLMVKH